MPAQSVSAVLPPVHSSFVASVRNLPVNLFAAVMGLSGLALAWRMAHGRLGLPAVVGEAIGAFAVGVFLLLCAAYLTKLARYPAAVHAEFHHPVAGNFFGTIVISVLLLAAVAEPYGASAAGVIWTIGALATFALCFVVVSRLLKGQVDVSHAAPAWLIPCVATLDIPVTGGHMAMSWVPELNLIAGAVGTVLAVLIFSMIVSRLVHRDPLAPAMTPSLMILVAPFAVGFLAYCNIVGGADRFAGLLFYFALFMFAVVAPKVFRRGIAFSPSWWAVGFPMAALVNAALRYAEFRASEPLWIVAWVLLASLTLVLAALTARTAHALFSGKLF
jgi:tellurite resistance protein